MNNKEEKLNAYIIVKNVAVQRRIPIFFNIRKSIVLFKLAITDWNKITASTLFWTIQKTPLRKAVNIKIKGCLLNLTSVSEKKRNLYWG